MQQATTDLPPSGLDAANVLAQTMVTRSSQHKMQTFLPNLILRYCQAWLLLFSAQISKFNSQSLKLKR